jgi:hypothetical protein
LSVGTVDGQPTVLFEGVASPLSVVVRSGSIRRSSPPFRESFETVAQLTRFLVVRSSC